MLRVTDNWVLTGATVFRHEALVWAGAFDERLGSFADGFVARKIALRFGCFFDPRTVAVWAVYPQSVSRRTASDPYAAATALQQLPKRLASDCTFPMWYPMLFARRWRFAVGRIAISKRPPDVAALSAVSLATEPDRLLLARICRLLPRRLAYAVGLAWLAIRTRSIGFRGLYRLLMSACWRRLARPRGGKGVLREVEP